MFLKHIYSPSVQEDSFTEEPPQPKSTTDSTEVEIPAMVDLVMEVLVVTPDWTEDVKPSTIILKRMGQRMMMYMPSFGLFLQISHFQKA